MFALMAVLLLAQQPPAATAGLPLSTSAPATVKAVPTSDNRGDFRLGGPPSLFAFKVPAPMSAGKRQKKSEAWVLVGRVKYEDSSGVKYSANGAALEKYTITCSDPPPVLVPGQTYTLTSTGKQTQPMFQGRGETFDGWQKPSAPSMPEDYLFTWEWPANRYEKITNENQTVTHQFKLTMKQLPATTVDAFNKHKYTPVLYLSPTWGNVKYVWGGVPAPETPKPTDTEVRVSDATKTGGDVSFLSGGGDISGFDRLFTDASPISGVAADGVSMLVVTASSANAGDATFTVSGAGGALYPLKSGKSIFKQDGSLSVTAAMRQIKGGFGAAVLYRPPSYFGRGQNPKQVKFAVKTADGAEKTVSIDLVRPPVVLVHGTYDNPSFCYEEHDSEDDAPRNLAPTLRSLGYDVSCVDWEETNGDKDPSDFQTNRLTVWQNRGGIREALTKMRGRNIAVTQADVACHSQGGVIARTYLRGYPFSVSLPPTHKHYTDPDHCGQNGEPCWYHRADNYYMGDIHRLITISTTHRGSACCNVFEAFRAYPNQTVGQMGTTLALSIFMYGVDKAVTGIVTGGFLNQTPGSLELQLIGPSPVPAHAIACVGTDEDMKNTRINHRAGATLDMGDYYGKLWLIYNGTSSAAEAFAVDYMAEKAAKNGNTAVKAMAEDFKRLSQDYTRSQDSGQETIVRKARDAMIYQFRKVVFEGDENDCTVALHSSWGLLKAPYVTKCEHCLHGWAPRYRVVQNKVIQLLVDDGSQFDPNGFPGYSGIQSRASTFQTMIRPMGDSPTGGSGTSGAAGSSGAGNSGAGGSGVGVSGTRGGTGVAGGGGRSNGGTAAAAPYISAPPISASTWAPLGGVGGHISFSGDEMTLAVNQGENGMPQAFAKSPLRGDFDISYHYDLKQMPTERGLDILMLAFRQKPDEDAGQVEIRREFNMGKNTLNFATDPSGLVTTPENGTGGRIRVRRTGSRWRVYRWDNGFKLVGDVPNGPAGPVFPGFVLNRFGSKQPMVAAVRPARKSSQDVPTQNATGQGGHVRNPQSSKPVAPPLVHHGG